MHYITPPRFLLTASWILPVAAPAQAGGGVLVDGGRIEGILSQSEVANLRSAQPGLPHEDLAGCVITPSLFNLHTHLDYTNLAHLVDFEGQTMFDWLEELVALSRSNLSDEKVLAASALAGARESALAGTGFIVDSTFSGAPAAALAEVGLKGLVGLELFGLDTGLADMLFGMWEERMARLTATAGSAVQEALRKGQIRLTVAPHAAYTVAPALWQKARQWADAHNLPLTCHLAESASEHDWIKSNNDRLHNYLLKIMPKRPDPEGGDESGEKRLDKLLSTLPWRGKGLSPTAHLQAHGLLDQDTIAAHCLQLNRDDIDILARQKVNVALCPRSNTIIKNGLPAPARLTAAGVNCGLGTDSRASCPDLSMLREARFLRQRLLQGGEEGLTTSKKQADGADLLPEIPGYEQLLAMLTRDGARAVGLEKETGSLSPGKAADIAAFYLDGFDTGKDKRPQDAGQALSALFEQAPACRLLIINGRSVVREGKLEAQLERPLEGRHRGG